MLLGISSDPVWRRYYEKLVRQRREQGGQPDSEPEFRLPSTIFGAFLVPVALFGASSSEPNENASMLIRSMQVLDGPRFPG
jgi:hypothetical protein